MNVAPEMGLVFGLRGIGVRRAVRAALTRLALLTARKSPRPRRRYSIGRFDALEPREYLAVDPLILDLAAKARASQTFGADEIDGAFSKVQWPSAAPNWYYSVEPYFGHVVGMGLVQAYRHQIANGGAGADADQNLNAVREWLEWCVRPTGLTDVERADRSGVSGLADRRLFFALRSYLSDYSQTAFVVGDGIESASGYFLLLLSQYVETAGPGALTPDLRAAAKDAVDAMGLVRNATDGLFLPRNRNVRMANLPGETAVAAIPYASADPVAFRYMQNNQDAVQGLMAAESMFSAAGETAYALRCRDWATTAQRQFFRFIPPGESAYANISEVIAGSYTTQHPSVAIWYSGGSGLTNIEMVASGQVADRAALFNAVDGVPGNDPVPNGGTGADGAPWNFSNAGVERWVFATAELGDAMLYNQYVALLRSTVDTSDWDPKTVYGFRIGLALMALVDAKSALPDMVDAPPTVSLSTASASLPENSSTATRIKFADISMGDDLLGGAVTLRLAGPHAAAFEIDSGGLYLRAGTSLDYETTPSLSVTVEADDPGVGTAIDDAKTFTLTLQDVNAAPTLRYTATVTQVRNSLNTSHPNEIGRVSVLDDGEGTNPLTLSGPDAAAFELVAGVLRLRSGVTLDPAAKPTLAVSISVDDPALPGGPESSVTLSLSVVRDSTRQFVPLYSFPQFTDGSRTQLAGWWRTLVDSATAADPLLVVINPQNGTADPTPGSGSDYGVYLDALRLLRANPNIQVLGYVYSQWGSRPLNEIRQNLDWYEQYYKTAGGASLIDGIFVDEMATDAAAVSFYQSLAADIRARTGLNGRYILANPGTLPAASLLSSSVANGVVIYENVESPTGFGDLALRDLAVPTVDGGIVEYAVIVHGVPAASDRDRVIRSTRLKGVDYVYVTDDTLDPNPFDTPPGFAATTPPEFHRPIAADRSLVIPENLANGSPVATIAGFDPDLGQTIQYTITGGNTGNSFAIGLTTGQLTVENNTAFDFESVGSWTLTISMTDSGAPALVGLMTVTITLSDAPEAPASLFLSIATVPESASVGTTIGTFSTTDPDALNTFTYTLVSGTGSTDNAAFSIVGDELRTNALLDFELQSSYSIRVRTTDQGGLFFEQAFTITVTDVNDLATALILSSTEVAENSAVGTQIGTFTASDTDAQSSFTYTLVSGTGSTGNAAFTIVGSSLLANAALDFEVQSGYSIRVRSTDQGGLFIERVFSISVIDVNEPPTALFLRAPLPSVMENDPLPQKLAELVVSDDLPGNNLFTLSGPDADLLEIVGGELRFKPGLLFDYETRPGFSAIISVDDPSVGTSPDATVSWSLVVFDVNEPPTAISLSQTTVSEDRPVGTLVGALSATDPDLTDQLLFSLVPGPGSTDNALFTINGSDLRTNAVLSAASKPTASIRVRVSDQGNQTFERVVAITVAPVNDAPVLNTSGSPFAILGVGSRQSAEMRQGILVSDLLARAAGGNPISDPDPGAGRGIAITALDESLGAFEFTLVTTNPAEGDWIPVDADGLVSESHALLLPESARLRFVSGRIPHHAAAAPFLSLESKLDAGISFRAWDQTSGSAGTRADTSRNGGSSAFSTAIETCRVYFEARLFRHFNRNAGLNVYTLEAEFNALAAGNNPAFEDRSTDAWTGFTVLLSNVPELATTPLYRLYYGVQFNTNGTEIDMGYRYLTTNLIEAQALENSGPASKRSQRAGAYFREQGVNSGTGILGYIYTTQPSGTQAMRQVYRTDIVEKPTRPAGTTEGARPTSFTPQENGDHVYTTNTTFETAQTGSWRVEDFRGFVRPLGGSGVIAPAIPVGATSAPTARAASIIEVGPRYEARVAGPPYTAILPTSLAATPAAISAEQVSISVDVGLIAPPVPAVHPPSTDEWTTPGTTDTVPPMTSELADETSATDELFTVVGLPANDLRPW